MPISTQRRYAGRSILRVSLALDGSGTVTKVEILPGGPETAECEQVARSRPARGPPGQPTEFPPGTTITSLDLRLDPQSVSYKRRHPDARYPRQFFPAACGQPRSIRRILRAARSLAPDGMMIEIYDGVGALPLFNSRPRSGIAAGGHGLHRTRRFCAHALLIACVRNMRGAFPVPSRTRWIGWSAAKSSAARRWRSSMPPLAPRKRRRRCAWCWPPWRSRLSNPPA